MTAVRVYAFTAMACCAFFHAPTVSFGVGQSFTGGTFSEDFDSLSSSHGASASWADFTNPFPGWALRFAGNQGAFPTVPENLTRDAGNSAQGGNWAPPGSYIASDGGINGNPGFFSYGSATGVANADRALGMFENNPNGNTTGGDREILLILTNDSTSTYNSFSLTYDGEQWRGTGGAADSLVFDYIITGANNVITEGNYTNGWTAVSTLNFSSPRFNIAGPSLDGNAAANRVAGIHATVTGISWQPGQWLTMRWWSNNNVGNDQGLAIDNLVFTVPEPGSCQLMLLGIPVLRRRSRRRQGLMARTRRLRNFTEFSATPCSTI